MSSLGCFINLKYATENNEDIFLRYASGIYYNDLSYILNNVYLTPNISSRSIPSILAIQLQECYHHEGIQLIVQYLIQNNIANALNVGYTSMSLESDNYKGFNSSFKFLVSKPLEIIKSAIGVHNFLDLILNTTAVWKPSNVVIWGDYTSTTFSDSKSPKHMVSTRNMLYKSIANRNHNPPIPETPLKLMELIFEDFSTERWNKNPIKRYRKVYRHIKTLFVTFKTKQQRLPYIVESICKKICLNESSVTVERHKIIELIHTVIYMVIPIEMFGTNSNRTKIMHHVSKLVNATISTSININLIVNDIKLADIDWLKPVSSLKMTKQEFLRARKLFSCFVLWLFNKFICNFMSSFFHVTNILQNERLVFYRHNIWQKITKKYMSKYFSDHLINQPDKVNSFLSISKNSDYIGKMSLHPKRDSFRLIVKPFKGRYNERISYLTYQKRIVRPMNSILNTIRNNNDCASVIDVVQQIYTYKKELLTVHDVLPPLYALKFDAKNAYDSLPHGLIDKVVKERLDFYTKGDSVYVQLFKQLDDNGVLRGRKLIVSDSLNDLDFFSNKEVKIPKVTVDSHETFCFTKPQILSYVRSQYKQTCIHTKFRSYFRKVGVFQGFPLSGTLFNLVYDYLVSELYELVGNDSETIILRLVDDFLVLSTQEEAIQKIKRLTARTLSKYNFKANRQKTTVSTEIVSFTGITIDVRHLVCYKQLQDYNNTPLLLSSFESLYKQLTNYGRMWIRHSCLFDTSLTKSGRVGARSNLLALLKSLVYKFTNSYRLMRNKKEFRLKDFANFLNKLLLEFSQKICYAEVDFSEKTFWKMTIKILHHKNIIHRKKRIK